MFDTDARARAAHRQKARILDVHYTPHGMNPATGKRWGSTRLELGEVGVMTLPEARRRALEAKAAVKAGRDPQREKTDAGLSASREA